jgi:hypothetical protein
MWDQNPGIYITRIRNTVMRMFGSKKNETMVQNIQYQQAEFIMNESLRGTQAENLMKPKRDHGDCVHLDKLVLKIVRQGGWIP